jgi:hypothetical protein
VLMNTRASCILVSLQPQKEDHWMLAHQQSINRSR